MKRLSLLASLIFVLCPLLLRPALRSASADGEACYAVAAQQGVWFYSRSDSASGLFILPYSYYVRVVTDGTPFCTVEYLEDSAPYKKITGYCLREQLTFVDFTPERPFLYKQVTLTYSLPDSSGGVFDSVEKTFVYYGTYYMGTACYWYVYADGSFGYVQADGEPDYAVNTDYLAAAYETETEQTAETESASGLSALQIVLICAAALACAGVAAFALYGKKKTPLPRRDNEEF